MGTHLTSLHILFPRLLSTCFYFPIFFLKKAEFFFPFSAGEKVCCKPINVCWNKIFKGPPPSLLQEGEILSPLSSRNSCGKEERERERLRAKWVFAQPSTSPPPFPPSLLPPISPRRQRSFSPKFSTPT